MKISLFDFDGTITRHDTFFTFARHAVGMQRFCTAVIRTLPALIGWKLGLLTNSAAKERLFGNLYRGMPVEDFHRACRSFAAIVNDDLRDSTVEMIRRHRDDGHRIVIVSASVLDWIRPWAESNGITEILATEIEVDSSGRLTGHFSTPNCHGAEKARRIRAYIPDIDGAEVWACGDSRGDDEMLALATHPLRISKTD